VLFASGEVNFYNKDMRFTENQKFEVGKVVITIGARSVLESADQLPSKLLKRHQSGDWGTLDKQDREANNTAIKYEGDMDRQARILSCYKTRNSDKIWIITEYDRSVTTILLPSEY